MWDNTEEVTDLMALERIDIDSLPPMRPPDRRPTREALQYGKNIVAYLRMLEGEERDKKEQWGMIDDGESSTEREITDDELWTILGCKRPETSRAAHLNLEPDFGVTHKWETWIKQIFLSQDDSKGTHFDICCALYAASNCYSNLLTIGQNISGYSEAYGIEIKRLMEIFNSIAYVNKNEMYNESEFLDLVKLFVSQYLSNNFQGPYENYFGLLGPGLLVAKERCGDAPLFFNYEIYQEKAEKNEATSARFGIEDDLDDIQGDSGDDSAPIQAYEAPFTPSYNSDDSAGQKTIYGETTRVKIAKLLQRDTRTLKNWEDQGYISGTDIKWPKGERRGSMVYYTVADVWPAILAYMPNRDKAKDDQLFRELMDLRDQNKDEDED